MRLIVGNCTNGMTPMTLLNRISVKSVKQQRHELPEVLGADDVAGDRVAHEAVGLLGHPLPLARHDRELAGNRDEEPRENGDRDRHDEHRAGDRPVAVAADDGPVEVLGAGGLEAPVAFGGGDADLQPVCGNHAQAHSLSSGSARATSTGARGIGTYATRPSRVVATAGSGVNGVLTGCLRAGRRARRRPGSGPAAARSSRRPARRSSRRGPPGPGPRRRPSRRS